MIIPNIRPITQLEQIAIIIAGGFDHQIILDKILGDVFPTKYNNCTGAMWNQIDNPNNPFFRFHLWVEPIHQEYLSVLFLAIWWRQHGR